MKNRTLGQLHQDAETQAAVQRLIDAGWVHIYGNVDRQHERSWRNVRTGEWLPHSSFNDRFAHRFPNTSRTATFLLLKSSCCPQFETEDDFINYFNDLEAKQNKQKRQRFVLRGRR